MLGFFFEPAIDLWYNYDELNRLISVRRGGGELLAEYSYDAFGNEKEPSDTDQNPFRYCGEYFDFETETYYLRNRNYDPTTGRFNQEDTAQDGQNWYAYCENNPIKNVDPSGFSSFTVLKFDMNALKKDVATALNVTSSQNNKQAEAKPIAATAGAETLNPDFWSWLMETFPWVSELPYFDETLPFADLLALLIILGLLIYYLAFLSGTYAEGGELTSEAIKDAVDSIDDAKKGHILQDGTSSSGNDHKWNKLVPDPRNPNNWDKIAAIIAQVLANGTETVYNETHQTFSKVLEIDGETVEVIYRYVNGVIEIIDAWIK